MSSNWDAFQEAAGAGRAAPAGLQQQRESGPLQAWDSFQQAAAAAPTKQPAWQTGGQLGSEDNGWNTPFYQEMRRQYEEETEKGTLSAWYDRKDFTGVVTYDRGDRKFGDIYDKGQKLGNVYEDARYADQADTIMGRLTLDSTTFGKMQTPEQLAAEVQKVREETTTWQAKGEGAAAYQDKVEARLTDWREDAEVQTNAAIVGTGIAGGAAVGAGFGSVVPIVGTAIGAVAGAALGGLGAWMNRDEIADQAARATVQYDMALETNSPAAVSSFMQSLGGLTMKQLSPLGNLTHGLYDSWVGDEGDGESEWYAVDPVTGESTRNGWWTAAGYASMVPDALGTFGGKFGLYAFQAAMSSTIGGQVGGLVFNGGATWDDSRGGFDNIFTNDQGEFDLGSSAAGLGNVAINAVQLGGIRGLFRAADDSQRMFGNAAGKVEDTSQRVSMGGYSYLLDDAGRAIEGSRRMSLGMLAPSEMLQGATSAMMARARSAAQGAGIPMADDYYRMAQSIAAGQRRGTNIMVNALGEAYEESVQAILEPLSHNNDVDWREVGDAAMAGGLMGTGMGMAAGARFAKRDQVLRAMAGRNATARGQLPPTDEAWKSMTDIEQRTAAGWNPQLDEAVKVANENFAAQQATELAANFSAPEARHAAAVLAEAASDTKNLAPKTDLAFRITQTEDASVPAHSVNASIHRVSELLKRHQQGLLLAAADAAGTEDAARAQLLADQAEVLTRAISRNAARFDSAANGNERAAIVQATNRLLEQWFNADEGQDADGNPISAELRLARARVATLVFTRDPIDNIGSFQLLLPQVNLQLSMHQADHVLQVGHSIIQPLGADFDGDKLRQQARMVLNDEMFVHARTGVNFVQNTGDVNILTRHYEEREVYLLHTAWEQTPGSPMQAAADSVLTQLETRLRRRYGHLERFDGPVATLIRQLKAGNTDARAEFLKELALAMGAEIQELGRQTLTNEWLWLDQAVQEALQQFQQMAAGRISTTGINSDYAAPIPQTSDASTRRKEAAATEGQTLGQNASGSEMFRLLQKLRYSVYRSNVLHNPAEGLIGLEELTRFFNMLGEGMVRSELDSLNATDDIAARVQWKLNKLSADSGVPVAVLANAAVPNVDSEGVFHGRRDGNQHQVSLLQSLLREEIQAEKREFASVLPADTDLQTRLARLEKLTKGASKRDSRAGQAFVEVYSETPLFELLGQGAITLGVNLTVGQYARRYVDLDPGQRQDARGAITNAPEYLGRKDVTNIPYGDEEVRKGHVSSFRSVVDSILDYGNHRITVGADGIPRGELAKTSDSVGASVRDAIADVQGALSKMGRTLTKESVTRTMQENPDWAKSVMDVVSNKAARAFFSIRKDAAGNPQLHMSPWLVEAFTMPPEQGEMHLLRNIIDATYNGLLKDGRAYDKLNDRFHRLMFRYAHANDGGQQMRELRVLMDQSKSVETFIQELNKRFVHGEAPYVAWVRDTAEFDADRPGGGWTTVLDGAAEREAFAKLKDRSHRLLESVKTEREVDAADAATGEALRRARAAERNPNAQGNTDAPLLQNLDTVIELAKGRVTVLSPDAYENQAVASTLAINPNSTDKAKNTPAHAPLGLLDAAQDYFGTNFEITRVSTGSYDIDTIISVPQLAARGPIRVMDHDGTVLEFPGLTRDWVIDNWHDPKARSFIRAVLFPSVLTPVAEGGALQQQFLTGPSLTALLTEKTYLNIFKEGQEALYAVELESMAASFGGRHELHKIINDYMIARTSALGRPADVETAQKMFWQARREIVQVMQAIGDYAGRTTADGDPLVAELPDGTKVTVLEALRENLAEGLRKRFLTSQFTVADTPFDKQVRKTMEIELAEKRIAAAEREQQGVYGAVEEVRRLNAPVEALFSEDPVQFAIDMLGVEPGTVTVAEKLRLMTLVKAAPNLIRKTPWATEGLQLLLNADGGTLPDLDGLPFLTDKQWSSVSRAVIAEFLERSSAVPASDGITTPAFPEWWKESEKDKLRYWDPTYSRVFDAMFEGPVAQAAIALHQRSKRAHTHTDKTIDTLLDRTLFHPERFGPWTADLPRAQEYADTLVISSAAGIGVPMAGVTPERQAGLSAAWRRTYDKPGPEHLTTSTVSVNLVLHGPELLTHLPVETPDSGTLPDMPLARLNGRFATGATVTLADGTVVDLFNMGPTAPLPGATWPGDPTGAAVDLKVITLGHLRRAIEHAVPAAERDTATVELAFLHPDTAPAGWMHNVYFEGLTGEVPTADVQPSGNDRMWTAGDGINRTAQQEGLQANKTGQYAIMLAKTFSLAETRMMELDWRTNLSDTLQRKTLASLMADNGQQPLAPVYFNAVHLGEKRRHFVRGRNVATGRVELWPAEQVIQWQRENPGQAIDTVLESADLWIPSEPVLRRLYGIHNAQSAPALQTEGPRQDYSDVEPFTGTFSRDRLREISGALRLNEDGTWSTRSLLDTDAGARRDRPRYSGRPGISDAQRNKLERAMEVQQARKESIWQARADHSGTMDRAGINEQTFKFAAAARSLGRRVPDWLASGVPFMVRSHAVMEEVERALVREMSQSASTDGRTMAWIFREQPAQGEAAATGVLSPSSLEKPAGHAWEVAPGDIVAVDVDSFKDDLERAKQRVQRLMDKGARIVLVSHAKQRNFVGILGAYITEGSYVAVAGSETVFEERPLEAVQQNIRGRVSSLMSMEPISAEGRILLFTAADFPIDENAVVALSDDHGDVSGEIAMVVDLVPSVPYADFAMPTHPRSVAQVKAHLAELATDPAKRKALVDQAAPGGKKDKAEFEAALDQLLEKWRVHEADDTIFPPGDFGPGSLIPFVREDSNGTALLLYRHGNKHLSREELEAQLTDSHAATGTQIAVYHPEHQDGATTREGRVEEVLRRSKYGLQVKMWVELRKFGDKLQLEGDGMKLVVTTASRSVMRTPESSMFRDWDVTHLADTQSMDSKNAWGSRLDNHRMGFALFGMDTEAELVEFFTGVARGKEGFAEATRHTLNLLQLLSDELPKQPLSALGYSSAEGMLAPDLFQVVADLVARNPELAARYDWLKQLSGPSTNDPAQERMDALRSIAQATVLYLMAPATTSRGAAQYNHIIRTGGMSAPGARSNGLKSQLMPPLYTDFFDHLRIDHPARVLLNEKMNQQFANKPGRTGWRLNLDFSVTMAPDDSGQHTRTGFLMVPVAHSSGDNPTLDAQAQERGDRQPVSISTQNLVSMVFGGKILADRQQKKAKSLLAREGIADDLWQLMNDVPPMPPTHRRFLPNPAEQTYMRVARDMADDFRQPLETELWREGHSDAEFQRMMSEFETKVRGITDTLGLDRRQGKLVHYWIRQQLGMPKDREEGAGGRVGYELAMNELDDIQALVSKGWLPTVDAEVPQIHHTDLTAIYAANRDEPKFKLRMELDSQAPAEKWSDWVAVALAFGETKNNVFDAMYLTATDGMTHSYIGKEDSLLGLPVSRNDLRHAQLFDPEVEKFVLSIDPHRAASMGETIILDRQYADLGSMWGAVRVGSRWVGQVPPASAVARRRAARKKWRLKNEIAFPQTTDIRNFREYGQRWIKETTHQNAVVRMASDLRAGMALLNPLLWVSAGFELGVRSGLEDMTNLLLGQNTSTLGAASSVYSPEEIKQLHTLFKALGTRPEFKGMVWGSLMYEREKGGNSILERGTRQFARTGGLMQDPTWMMRADVIARRYMESVLAWVQANPVDTVISTSTLVQKMMADPTWVSQHMPMAHQAALATIANLRSLKPTPVSLFIRGIYEPLSRNPKLMPNLLGNFALRIPLMFSGYAANVATTVTGMQGASAMMATVLNGRTNPMGGIKSWLAGDGYTAGKDARFDMSTAMEGLDLSKAFVQGGVTHTALFMLGSLAGTLGLGTGEDEEERRLRRAQKYQTGAIVYDPRDIINDFRNADAVYLDWLPFGLDRMFAVPDPDGTNTAHSMAQPHWMLRQFVSPLLGMEKFFSTGDLRQIIWGFQDAIGSMPLVNTMTWADANQTTARLMASAPTDDEAEQLDVALDAWGSLIRVVATYERMLFENSFVNMLYTQMDKYDRDPWVLPERDAEGNIMRDRLDQPRPSKALEDFVDPETGEVRMGSVSRDWWDATLHGFAENRGTLALAYSLFTGQGLGGTTLRDNMTVKTRQIEKPSMEQGDAQSLLMGLYAQGGGAETMTADTGDSFVMSQYLADGTEMVNERGARAVVQGIWKQSVQLGSPALEGVFIPFEMRQTIQRDMMAELIEEGLAMGLSEYDAKGRMYDVWYGPSDDPAVQGLGDLLWSDQIPYTKQERYYQLNTTYVMGPDGRPWATGWQREGFFAMFGATSRYLAGDVGLGVDGSLNSVDAASRINTGMRALEKTDDSWMVPTPEEIAEEIADAIKEAMDSDVSGKGGTGGSGYRGYSRGGGGGGGYSYRINSAVRNDSTYSRNTPYVNTDNTILRRASIRRERFSSTRGRLNQWQ